MLTNRSMPAVSVIPELGYPNIGEAIAWLEGAFGFRLRWRVGGHRAQMWAEGGAVVLTESGGRGSLMVRVEDVDAHYRRAAAFGARILAEPADFPYGERQYGVEDLGGNRWKFSQSIADVDPASWGAEVGELASPSLTVGAR